MIQKAKVKINEEMMHMENPETKIHLKKFDVPKPVVIGQKVEVSIYAENGHGEGIAQLENFFIFVKGAKKGEKCKVKITDLKRTYATAQK